LAANRADVKDSHPKTQHVGVVEGELTDCACMVFAVREELHHCNITKKPPRQDNYTEEAHIWFHLVRFMARNRGWQVRTRGWYNYTGQLLWLETTWNETG